MSHLTLAERYEISVLKKQGFSNSRVATELSRDKSTIGRELKRNADSRNQKYRPDLAQKKSDRRHQEKNKHVVFTDQIKDNETGKSLLKKWN